MPRPISRALATALVGGLAGGACLVLAFARHPALTLEMDRDLPRLTSGFYPVENQGETFAWTSARAALRLPGLDRRSPWLCSVRLRGARPAPLPQPIVDIGGDGVTLARHAATNEYRDVEVTVPLRSNGPGLTLTIASSPTFVPGPSDRRELGVQVDRVVCRPGGERTVLPPLRAFMAASVAAATFGAALGLIGPGLSWAIGGTLLLAIAQTIPLTAGPAPYSVYQDSVAWIAIWITVPIVLGVTFIERRRKQSLHPAARFVLLFSGAVLFLKLLALLHPSKLVVDAVFHAHRFEWVLAGRYYFTQPLPDGVQFPYAIALYVFAAPWSAFTRDHVELLRIVVCASQAIAGALLYPMVACTWKDRRTAAAAVVLFHFVPLPYIIIGNANLTYAFGQSAALVTVAAATVWTLGTRNVLQLAGLFVLASLAFLSHVGTFPLLLSTLVVIAVLYRLGGGSALAAPARAVFIAAALAVGFSVVSYYGQFSEVYKTLDRVRGRATSAVAPPEADGAEQPAAHTARPAPMTMPLSERATHAGALGVRAVGWSILLLALVGAWRLWIGGARDRLGLVLVAWGVTCVAFLVFAVSAPVDLRFQRYTDEFIDRVYDATTPAAVILAAHGAMWAWSAGLVPRIAAAALLLTAGVGAVKLWMGWLQ